MGLKNWFQDDDNFIIDRGIRDAIPFLERNNFSHQMPSYLKPGQTQHETQQANADRCVTKVRWTVESYHGRLKKWKFCQQPYQLHK